MCLNRYAAVHALMLIPPSCLKRIVKCVSSSPPNFITEHPLVTEIIIRGTVVHTRARTKCSTRNICKTHNFWSSNHTPNFSDIRPAVLELRKRGTHVRMCSCTTPLTFIKLLAIRLPTTYRISAQSIQLFPKYGKRGHICACAREHVQCTPPMACVICIAIWCLSKH